MPDAYRRSTNEERSNQITEVLPNEERFTQIKLQKRTMRFDPPLFYPPCIADAQRLLTLELLQRDSCEPLQSSLRNPRP